MKLLRTEGGKEYFDHNGIELWKIHGVTKEVEKDVRVTLAEAMVSFNYNVPPEWEDIPMCNLPKYVGTKTIKCKADECINHNLLVEEDQGMTFHVCSVCGTGYLEV